MTRDRGRDRADLAGAETIGAILLFGVFVATIAALNVTAVPDAGLAAEQEHHTRALDAFNGLQADAETIAAPGSQGATVARSLPLAPEADTGRDFFSFFLARPAKAAGEVAFVADYGNLTVSHRVAGQAATVYDVGGPASRVPVGRLAFDPHPMFRNAGIVQLEQGAVVVTDLAGESVRHSPAVSVTMTGTTTHVSVLGRVLNGTDATLGGTGALRLRLVAESATVASPAHPNAESVTLRLETAHGRAWGDELNATSSRAGLVAGTGYETTVSRGAAPGGLDVVAWTVHGVGDGNDVRLTTGLAIFEVKLG